MYKADILISGVGGQGTILAGKLIAEVALAEGLDVKTAETHGMAQRGGSVVTHVRLGEKVYSPLISRGKADFLLSFEQLEALRWLPYLLPQGTAIVNTQVLEPLPVLTGRQEYPAGIMEEVARLSGRLIAVDSLQIEPVSSNPRTMNTLLLGILAGLLPFPAEIWRQTLRTLLPDKLQEINLQAFTLGFNYRQ